MAKERANTRVDPDTKRAVEKYQEENDLGQSEALRRLIRSGLAAEGHPVTAADGGATSFLEELASTRVVSSAVGLFLLTILSWGLTGLYVETGRTTLALITLGTGGASLIIGAGLIAGAALAQLALAEPLRGLVGLDTGEEADA